MTAVGSYGAGGGAAVGVDAPGASAGSRYLFGICAALLIGGVCAVAAQQREIVAASTPIEFNIPAQQLAGALQAYGERTGVQVLYESNSATGRKSAPVEGTLTPEEALNLLLKGTDLKVQYIRPDAITLASRSARADRPPASPLLTADLSLGTLQVRASNDGNDTGALRDYSESLQLDIQKALQKNIGSRGGSYQLVVDLWIDPSRTIQRTQLLRSTGDQHRDAAVTAALQGLTVSRTTPTNASQPVRIAIRVKSFQ
ncbi:STN domain-containing protein [Bradyrhizobium acaciae]|uniref:STN domain-containing protein n=1 Tax=Bradyrhizobium acaciae TaxID=2683706 RepID=UPI001E41963B|nr:secretin and TonB N-terminal domain-containing protein [Bradyrhizobium acaciae]MCC8982598.1 secretin and TonB N-terminal domain-containing protein [Bradyrhizobium acaciae]